MIQPRIAGPEDCRAVFELSNDPVVRSVSFSSEPITYDDHLVWFSERLADPRCLFILFYDEKTLVAQVRFSRESIADTAEISISVASAYRGKGLALGIMHQACDILTKTWPVKHIKALVKLDNEASNRYFEKAGYAFSNRTQYRGSDCNVYLYEC